MRKLPVGGRLLGAEKQTRQNGLPGRLRTATVEDGGKTEYRGWPPKISPPSAPCGNAVCDPQRSDGHPAIFIARLGESADGMAVGVYRLQLEETNPCRSVAARLGES